MVTPDSILTVGGDNLPYTGSQWLPVRRALKDLAPGPNDVFVDLGSGKGKTVLIAGRLPYGRVVGVELDGELDQCAQSNIQQARTRLRAKEVTSVAASALEWPIPDDLSVVFMFNPFIGQTFQKMVERILESYDVRPRSLRLIYGLPAEHDWLISTGRVVVENVIPCFWPSRPGWWRRGDVIVTYRVVAASEQRSAELVYNRSTPSKRAIQHWSRANGYRFTLRVSGEEVSY